MGVPKSRTWLSDFHFLSEPWWQDWGRAMIIHSKAREMLRWLFLFKDTTGVLEDRYDFRTIHCLCFWALGAFGTCFWALVDGLQWTKESLVSLGKFWEEKACFVVTKYCPCANERYFLLLDFYWRVICCKTNKQTNKQTNIPAWFIRHTNPYAETPERYHVMLASQSASY